MVQSYVLHWFQSTPPRWGRRIRITRLRMRFNPRPTRGATSANNARAYTNVFQSTPPREGQLWAHDQYIAPNLSFNPRPHTRGDTLWLCEHQALHVSIHAPTRGATRLAITAPFHAVFQSTPPHEGRQRLCMLEVRASTFQSTPPHEGQPVTR